MVWLRSANISSLGRKKLLENLYHTYTKERIEQLFNIIIEWPDSQAALEDVRVCLGNTDLRGHLTRSLKKVLDNKLLHPGVNTADILTAYIAAIRALTVLDPSGVVLQLVCQDVRKYLKTREDTVRCIVQSLISETSTELTEELQKTQGLQLDHSFQSPDDYECLDGEIPLHQCEVMLKDIGDSKRINSLLHTVDGGCPELQTQAFPVNALVLSAQFWPQFKNETLELPPEIGEALEVYTKAFQLETELLCGNLT